MRKVCAKSQCRLFAKSIDTLKRRCYNVITTQKRTNLAVYRKQALMKRFIAIAAALSLGAHSGTYWCAGDSSGRYPLPNDGLDAAVCAVQSIADGRGEIFAEHTPLSESEMDAAAESGLYIMPNGGEFYALNAQELEQYLAIEERIAQETGNISPEDFGVYESADIDLMLYKDILDEYGIA